MEPTEAELERHFASLENDPLLHAASERLTLTELAQRSIEKELRRRGLPLPPAQQLARSPEPELQHWVTVERFRDLSEAIVARSTLEAEEIPCFLRDENTVRMDWQISNFIGGMRLQVLEEDLEAAKTVLAGLAAEYSELANEALDEFQDKCPNCGSTNVSRDRRWRRYSFASLWLMGLPLPLGKRVWTCAQCGTQWKDED